jgi:hypothetical protein
MRWAILLDLVVSFLNKPAVLEEHRFAFLDGKNNLLLTPPLLSIALWYKENSPTQIVTAGPDYTYYGQKGIEVWQNDWGCAGSPPIERDYGTGTKGGHFDEACFADELMTGFIKMNWSNPPNPLSKLSIAALEDIGYTNVDYSQAEPYTPSATCCANGGVRRLGGGRRRRRSNRMGARTEGGGGGAPPGLSAKGRRAAVAYGRQKLREAKANGPKKRINGDLVFVGDLMTNVLIEEGGIVYEVEVVADE